MTQLINRAAALRADFDRGFAGAPPPPRANQALYLAITVADRGYAVALAQVQGLFADCPVAPLPSRAASCLGLARFAGGIVAVHGLRALLGHPAAVEMPRWLLLAGDAALGFDRLDDCLQRDTGAVASGGQGSRYVTGMVAGRPLLGIAALIDGIAKQEGKN